MPVTTKEKFDLTTLKDGSFILQKTDKNGQIREFQLSEDDVITLCMSVENIAKAILERRFRHKEGVTPIFGTIVSGIKLETDVHKSELHMEVTSQSGAQSIFVIPFQVAQGLSDTIPARIDEIRLSLSGNKH